MIFNIQNENNTYKKISIVSKDSLGRISIPGPGPGPSPILGPGPSPILGPGPSPYNPTLTLNKVNERDVLNVCLAPLSDIYVNA